MTQQCLHCEEEFITEPVRDETEVFWMGVEHSRVWCSEDCANDYAESSVS